MEKRMNNYEDLNQLSFEELKKIEQFELERITDKENERQALIARIFWLRSIEDLRKAKIKDSK
jgi:hypothetical protein